VQATLAWPLGALSDRVPRHVVLAGGTAVFALVYGGLALAHSGWVVWPLFALYGVYVAATEGVARAWVADQVGERAIGTAYGIFFLGTAVAALVASIAAGLLWTHVGPQAPFALGAVAAAAASVLLVAYSLVQRAGALPAKLALAGLGACVLFGAGFEHASLGGLLRGADAADALPLAPAQPCPAPPRAIAVHHALLRTFPRPSGLVYTGIATSGPSVVGDAYLPRGLAAARAAYEESLAAAGYAVTGLKREATETDVVFEGGALTGEVALSQTCRGRTTVKVRLGGKD
jgi:MFS family permease